jgi:hypothetical protein
MGLSLKLQKRLAASVLNCGVRKVWMDPNECNEISMANSRECPAPAQLGSVAAGPPRRIAGQRLALALAASGDWPCWGAAAATPTLLAAPDSAGRSAGQNIRKLVKDGFVIRKPTKARLKP